MNLDLRAQRAADGVRATSEGVDPTVKFAELTREERARHRSAAATAVLGVLLVVAGVGWFAMTQLDGGQDSAPPAAPPTSSATEIALEPGRTVGTKMSPPMVAQAPSSWSIWGNGRSVFLEVDGSDASLEHVDIEGPIRQVYDIEQQAGVPVPPEGYADWLRYHPKLRVLDERVVTVDGDLFPQLTVTMARDAPGDEVALGMASDTTMARPGWPDYSRGELVTITVMEIDGKTMVVSSAVGMSNPLRDEVAAGLDLVLSTLELPN